MERRSGSGSAPMLVPIVPNASAIESRDKPEETATANSLPPAQAQPSIPDDAKSLTRAKPKSKTRHKRATDRNVDIVKRPYGDGSSYGYIYEKPPPQYSPEGTMGPH